VGVRFLPIDAPDPEYVIREQAVADHQKPEGVVRATRIPRAGDIAGFGVQ
jgi:hypothetical protein